MKFPQTLCAVAMTALALTGCSREGDLVVQEGVGITALRTVCPSVGVPDYTGNMTLFSPPSARTLDALDLTASITNVRSQCDDSGEQVYSTATFDVLAQRRDTRGARTVTLPYFSSVIRGGNAVVAKRLGTVTVAFADGEERARGTGVAGALVDRAAATLPLDVRERITRRRRAGQEEAAVDPLSDPAVRTALARASFELLIGFQLSDDQLAYNATR